MTNAKFKKFYTAIHFIVICALIYDILIFYNALPFDITLLLTLVTISFIVGFAYSLGFLGGKIRGYGYSHFLNKMFAFTLIIVILVEVETWLYFIGYTNVLYVLFLQVAVISIFSLIFMYHDTKGKTFNRV